MTNMRWLTPLEAKRAPVTFGVPWAKGALQKTDGVTLLGGDGASVAVQEKKTAYWPDGSVKWTALSAVLPTEGEYTVEKGNPVRPASALTASQDETGAVTVKSDLLVCRMEPGVNLITGLVRHAQGMEPMSAVLIAQVENVSEDDEAQTVTVQKLRGEVTSLTLEEAGPLCAVVKAQGIHKGCGRTLFPFTVRLYFYQGSAQVRMVHTFVFDADQEKDFIKGMGVELRLAAAGELFNRHVAFACEQGLFYEGVQGMYSGSGSYRRGVDRRKDFNEQERLAIYETQQIKGQFVNFDRAEQEAFAKNIDDNAVWGSFRLNQESCDHYSITKRTVEGCAYITAAQGNRSAGTVFFGSSAGIVAASVRDFWQKSPMAFEVARAAGQSPAMTLWLCSPYAQSMDFRAYDKVSHSYSYGGVLNEPTGIANTNEITLRLYAEMPGKQEILEFARDAQKDALLVANPEVYEETAVFGSYWKRQQDPRMTDARYEKLLKSLVDFYMNEVEQRKWYGFWDYGDVMHTYDPTRHCWRYDVGGYAWQNTELCNTYVNWLMFLRTGDYSIYRFARAMSRHCSEVDLYHAGQFAGFGSRHNVRHWGCGAKEVRISMAGHHRFFYYLTADERMGDIFDEVKDADYATLTRDPMRSYFGTHEGFSHTRVGPDWTSYLSNWMTRWERYEDEAYRDKLLRSVASVKSAPLGLSSGSTFHYDPTTGIMHYMGAENPAGHTHLGDGNYQQHMVICFGGPETWFELADLLDDDAFRNQLAQFGAFYGMTPQERNQVSEGRFNEENDEAWRSPYFGTRMIAYAGYRLNQERFTKMAIEQAAPTFRGLSEVFDGEGNVLYRAVPQADAPRALREAPTLSTNAVSQWSLNYMETVNLIPKQEEK